MAGLWQNRCTAPPLHAKTVISRVRVYALIVFLIVYFWAAGGASAFVFGGGRRRVVQHVHGAAPADHWQRRHSALGALG